MFAHSSNVATTHRLNLEESIKPRNLHFPFKVCFRPDTILIKTHTSQSRYFPYIYNSTAKKVETKKKEHVLDYNITCFVNVVK